MVGRHRGRCPFAVCQLVPQNRSDPSQRGCLDRRARRSRFLVQRKKTPQPETRERSLPGQRRCMMVRRWTRRCGHAWRPRRELSYKLRAKIRSSYKWIIYQYLMRKMREPAKASQGGVLPALLALCKAIVHCKRIRQAPLFQSSLNHRSIIGAMIQRLPTLPCRRQIVVDAPAAESTRRMG